MSGIFTDPESDLMPCGCRLDQSTFLDVGRGVLVRERIQWHIYGRGGEPPVPWIEEFSEDPHNHRVRYAVWYLPKSMLAIAEDVLIESLRPLKNKANTSGGFSRPDLWTPCVPDVVGDTRFVMISRTHREQLYVRKSALKNRPGVYAFFVDPARDHLDLLAALGAHSPLGEICLKSPLMAPLRRRARVARVAERLLRTRIPDGRKKTAIVEELEEEA